MLQYTALKIHPQARGQPALRRGSPGAVGCSLNTKSHPNAGSTARGTRWCCPTREPPPAAPRPWHPHPVSPTTSRASCRPDAGSSFAQMTQNALFFGLISVISARANLTARGQDSALGRTTARQPCQRGGKINLTLVKTFQFPLKFFSALMFAVIFLTCKIPFTHSMRQKHEQREQLHFPPAPALTSMRMLLASVKGIKPNLDTNPACSCWHSPRSQTGIKDNSTRNGNLIGLSLYFQANHSTKMWSYAESSFPGDSLSSLGFPQLPGGCPGLHQHNCVLPNQLS